MLTALMRDLSYGTHAFPRDKAFAAVAVISLALGIGANTAVFSVLDGLAWKKLPVAGGRGISGRVDPRAASIVGRSNVGAAVGVTPDSRPEFPNRGPRRM